MGHTSEFPFGIYWWTFKNPKIRILKKWKSIWRCHYFKLVQQKTQSNDVRLLRYGVWQIIFCHFRPFCALLPHHWPQKLKFGKNVKSTWRYYAFTHVHDKSRSYDLWFLRYKVTKDTVVIVGHFLPLDPPNPKNQNFKKIKKTPGDIIILHLCTTNDDIWCMAPSRQNFGLFFALLPPNILNNQNIKKWK